MNSADLDRADVTLAAAGDQDAFERIYRRHVPRVTRLASWLVDGGDVDDAVQEVFIRVWQKARDIQEVAEKLGMPARHCHSRASQYRARGIPLKPMMRRRGERGLDTERLYNLARELVDETEEEPVDETATRAQLIDKAMARAHKKAK